MHRLCRLYAENSSLAATKSERVQLFWQQFNLALMRSVTMHLRISTYTVMGRASLPLWLPRDDAGNLLPVQWQNGLPAPKRARPSMAPAPRVTTGQPYA